MDRSKRCSSEIAALLNDATQLYTLKFQFSYRVFSIISLSILEIYSYMLHLDVNRPKDVKAICCWASSHTFQVRKGNNADKWFLNAPPFNVQAERIYSSVVLDHRLCAPYRCGLNTSFSWVKINQTKNAVRDMFYVRVSITLSTLLNPIRYRIACTIRQLILMKWK